MSLNTSTDSNVSDVSLSSSVDSVSDSGLYADGRTVTKSSKRVVRLWRTELCDEWKNEGNCKFGDRCRYAHGTTQLHCSFFQLGRECRFGDRCRKVHGHRPVVRAPSVVKVSPYRYRICSQWYKTGQDCVPDCGYAHGWGKVICAQFHRTGCCDVVVSGSSRCDRGVHIHHTQPGGSMNSTFSFQLPTSSFPFGAGPSTSSSMAPPIFPMTSAFASPTLQSSGFSFAPQSSGFSFTPVQPSESIQFRPSEFPSLRRST